MSKTIVNDKVVDVNLSTKPSKDAQKYDQHWKLNFENVDTDDLLLLATKHVVITLQRKFRDVSVNGRGEFTDAEFDVAEVMAETRTREKLTGRELILRELSKMSNEEKEAFFEENMDLSE